MILCAVTGTVQGQAKKINVSILRKTGKSTIVTHGTIRVNGYDQLNANSRKPQANETLEFFLNEAELSLNLVNSANSGNLINH